MVFETWSQQCLLVPHRIKILASRICGELCLNLIDKLTPHLHRIAGADQEGHPETHHDNERGATYALLAGFCLMLVMDVLLG